MGCTVTFHDRVGHDRIATAVEPLSADAALALLDSAVCETVRVALDRPEAEVELTLCSDPEMERLNFDHMGERGPTDVLSFPLHEWRVDGQTSHLSDDDGVSPPGPLLLAISCNWAIVISRSARHRFACGTSRSAFSALGRRLQQQEASWRRLRRG